MYDARGERCGPKERDRTRATRADLRDLLFQIKILLLLVFQPSFEVALDSHLRL